MIVADDDGVAVVRRDEAHAVLKACQARADREAAVRERYAAGELSLDVSGMRDRLAERGLRYVDQAATVQAAHAQAATVQAATVQAAPVRAAQAPDAT